MKKSRPPGQPFTSQKKSAPYFPTAGKSSAAAASSRRPSQPDREKPAAAYLKPGDWTPKASASAAPTPANPRPEPITPARIFSDAAPKQRKSLKKKQAEFSAITAPKHRPFPQSTQNSGKSSGGPIRHASPLVAPLATHRPNRPNSVERKAPAHVVRHESPLAAATTTWRDQLIPLLNDAKYQPTDRAGLERKLRIPAADTVAFAEFLVSEEQTGHIMKVRDTLYVLPKKLGFSVGHLQMNERGFGFLVPINPAEPDFYVGPEDTATAFHGDLVLARLQAPRRGKEDRLRGEVVKVVSRKRRQLVGTLRKTPMFYYVVPDEGRINRDIYVAPPDQDVPLGYKVVVELKDWVNAKKPPEGLITQVLGAPDAAGVDLLSIIHKYDLPTSFPEAVEQEAANIPALPAPEEIARREDFRSLFTLTIDPDDAKDFDDALSYIQHGDGDFEIFVHIADVSHYVAPGAALDREARERGNSVYLVDRVIPMLPEKLSNGICSLMPEVDRLVKTAIIRLNPKGHIKKFRFAEGIIHSQKRFTYKEAFALLQKAESASPLAKHLHALNHMAQLLRKNRFANGALDLDFPEVKVRVNELGIPTKLERVENDISHQLIEEFMLLANDVVAQELKQRHRPGLYRVHENPDPERLEEFRATAKSMGFKAGDLTARNEIQKLLDSVRGQAGESVIKIGLLRSLKRAAYSPKPLGHYGLAKTNYTHFTSPIRRYADLIVHRVLFTNAKTAKDLQLDSLAKVATHLSTTERTASEAEQESVKLKKLEFFAREAQATKRTSFQAMILEVRANGLVVELPEFVVQGRVHLSALEGDLFVFNARELTLEGQRTRAILRAGQSLPVEVAEVDLARRQVDFKISKAVILKINR